MDHRRQAEEEEEELHGPPHCSGSWRVVVGEEGDNAALGATCAVGGPPLPVRLARSAVTPRNARCAVVPGRPGGFR